eukprot:evm.model.scf_468.6 EVM.evm.TU.scf_468.6   scf_468:34546-36975(-)
MGSWAQIVKERGPEPKRVEGKTEKDVRVVVVDTNAIIKGLRLETMGDKAVTIPEVLEEVRDKRSRAWLANLPFGIEVMEPDAETQKVVTRFAQATGDLHFLSLTDLKLVALAYTLERDAHGFAHLKQQAPKSVIHSNGGTPRSGGLPGWGNVPNPEDWRVLDELEEEEDAQFHIAGPRSHVLSGLGEDSHLRGEDLQPGTELAGYSMEWADGSDDCNSDDEYLLETLRELEIRSENIQRRLNEIAKWRSGDFDKDTTVWTPESSEQATSHAEESSSPLAGIHAGQHGNPAEADCCCDDDWEMAGTRKANSRKESNHWRGQQSEARVVDPPTAPSDNAECDKDENDSQFESTVGCLTSDYNMQNVLIQMGLRLVAPDGQRITRLVRWALRCSACFTVTKEAGKVFCPKCGNAALEKVEVTVGPGGKEIFGVRNHHRLRGTKYSLPPPKGGKGNRDPILSEDVLMARMGPGRSARKPVPGHPRSNGDVQDVWMKTVTLKKSVAELLPNPRKNPNERKQNRRNRRKR